MKVVKSHLRKHPCSARLIFCSTIQSLTNIGQILKVETVEYFHSRQIKDFIEKQIKVWRLFVSSYPVWNNSPKLDHLATALASVTKRKRMKLRKKSSVNNQLVCPKKDPSDGTQFLISCLCILITFILLVIKSSCNLRSRWVIQHQQYQLLNVNNKHVWNWKAEKDGNLQRLGKLP